MSNWGLLRLKTSSCNLCCACLELFSVLSTVLCELLGVTDITNIILQSLLHMFGTVLCLCVKLVLCQRKRFCTALLKLTRRQCNPHLFGAVRCMHASRCGGLRQLFFQGPVPRRSRYYRSWLRGGERCAGSTCSFEAEWQKRLCERPKLHTKSQEMSPKISRTDNQGSSLAGMTLLDFDASCQG